LRTAESGSNKAHAVGQPRADELLTAILASSADAIVALDPKTRITAWNPAAEQLFGFTVEDAIGR
jgi:PAS domain S-box-containing protein